ncbi:MAG TPA: hypothetical protein ENI27_01430 [bacterium]|nr:hypothetical protein [bacterium]
MTTDSKYLLYDPFQNDRGGDVRCQKIAMVTTTIEHECIGTDAVHTILAGTRARYESAEEPNTRAGWWTESSSIGRFESGAN